MSQRILIVGTTLTPKSGWGTNAMNTTAGLAARGHTVAALVQEHTPESEHEQILGLPDPLLLLRSPLAIWQTRQALKKAVREFKPDAIHFLVEHYALAMPLIKRTPPWVFTINATWALLPLYYRLLKPLLKRVYQQADHVISPSSYSTKRVLDAITETCGSTLAAKVEHKLSRYHLGMSDLPANQPSTDDTKHILYVGGIKPRKGIAEIIEGCAAYGKQSQTKWHLHLVGTNPDGGYRQHLQEIMGRHGIEEQITFHGHIDETALDRLYAQADLFIMLSKSHGHHFEGFGLVFLEANMRGIPTIGPTESGCEDAVDNGVSGYSVDGDNPQMIAERIGWVLDDHKIDPQNCIKWAKEHSIDRQAEEFEIIYKAITSAPTK